MLPSLQQQFIRNINSILGKNKVGKVAVAVSGGVDSVALLYLVVDWGLKNNIHIVVFCVDHNLRPESKVESAYVEELSKMLGVEFVSLSWSSQDKKTALQERARQARYDLMCKYCQKLDVHLLFTAHHRDDMLETYLIKKSKKSSLLALKPNITYFWNNVWIVRPLFNIEKRELINYLQQNNIQWFEDVSNSLDKYERNRFRKAILKLTQEEKKLLFDEYNLVINKAKELNQIVIKSLAEVISIYNYGFGTVDINKFNELEEEIKIYILNYLLVVISGRTILPRYRNLKELMALITERRIKTYTLHHCMLVNSNGQLIVYKEKEFIIKQNSIFTNKIIWDNRFELVVDSGELRSCSVSCLSMTDYVKLKDSFKLEKLAKYSNNNHISILFTLPVIKNLEKVIAIPHISYYNDERFKDSVKAIFKPNFISRFTHFF